MKPPAVLCRQTWHTDAHTDAHTGAHTQPHAQHNARTFRGLLVDAWLDVEPSLSLSLSPSPSLDPGLGAGLDPRLALEAGLALMSWAGTAKQPQTFWS